MQVSLITCTSNSEETLEDCCNSIYLQTYKNLEHIIIDNNSNDNTLDILNKSKINNQKIFQQKSKGIYGALNEGMKMSNGKIIGILHSDDEFIDEDIIEIISKKFLENNLDVLFSNIFYTEKNNINKITRKWTSDLTEGIQQNNELIQRINNGWMPPHTSLFFKKDLLKEIGYYDESFKISSDYDFIIRLFKQNNLKVFFLNKFSLKMRSGGISNKSLSNIFKKMREDIKIMKKFKLNVFKTILIKNLSKIKQFF